MSDDSDPSPKDEEGASLPEDQDRKPDPVPGPGSSGESGPDDRFDIEEAVDEELAMEAGHAEENRRDFLQKAGGVLIGGAAAACPAAVAIFAISDPLIRKKSGGGVIARLTTLDALPEDGTPQVFKVVVDKKDAWTIYENLPLGLVYARRTLEGGVVVHSAICPHAGCAVEYRNTDDLGMHYYCPCHESSFRVDGERLNEDNPSKRPLDTLEVDEEKLAEGEIWVKFQKFKAGVAEKKPVS